MTVDREGRDKGYGPSLPRGKGRDEGLEIGRIEGKE